MADDAQKQWLASNLNAFALQKVQDQVQLLGKALPAVVRAIGANGAIVTVAFTVNSSFTLPVVTLPRAISKYLRDCVQVGDLGVVRPIDTYLGGVSGLGEGTADLTQRANLSTLVFEPVGNVGWTSAPTDMNWLSAPGGFLAQDDTAVSSITLTPAQIVLLSNSNSVTINAEGIIFSAFGKTVKLTSGGFTIDGIVWDTHEHGGVMSGGSNTSGPVAP